MAQQSVYARDTVCVPTVAADRVIMLQIPHVDMYKTT